MIHITDHAEGCILHVHAQPGAKRNRLVGAHGNALKVAVTAPADKGRANEAILAVLADTLQLKPSQLELITGPTSKQKKILVRNLTAELLRTKLRSLLPV